MNKENPYDLKPWLENYDDHVHEKIEYPNITINRLLFNAKEKYGTHTFLCYQSEEFTYKFIYKKIKILAKKLKDLGISKGDRVAIILPNTPQFIIAYYAILSVGGIVVAMNPRSTQTELEYLFLESGATHAFCLDSQATKIKLIKKRSKEFLLITSKIDDYKKLKEKTTLKNYERDLNNEVPLMDLIQDGDLINIPIEDVVDSNDPAIFQFSGGTTGDPKAAIGLHRNIIANVSQFIKWCDLKKGGEVILAAIPLYHVYGMVLAMNMAVALGGKIVLISDPSDVNFILDQIEENKVTFYPGVPTMYHAINNNEKIKSGNYHLDSIKACISGSFSLHPSIKNDFEHLTGGKLIEGYGLSEAPTATHCNPLYGKNKNGSIGMPLPDVDVRIVDLEDGIVTLPQGEIGEMIIRGPQVMAGYFEKPNETSSAIRGGWLFTGDIAKMDEDGYFYLVDRKKSLIKVNGLQVWPNEVEDVINSHPQIKECAVGGILDPVQGERVVSWIVTRDGAETSLDEIRDWCKQKLSGYKIPKEVFRIEKIPRTSVGKILRRKLIAEYTAKKEV
ncbi:MAG: AMP-binding protein [Pelolinea sp.]|nr:AMP-binding protein [Pelolinea sp.]